MEPLKIHRPVFDRAAHGASEYAARMVEHLQDVEDWQRTMHEVESEGWGVGQMWVMEHKDGRVANLPDRCPTSRCTAGPRSGKRRGCATT